MICGIESESHSIEKATSENATEQKRGAEKRNILIVNIYGLFAPLVTSILQF